MSEAITYDEDMEDAFPDENDFNTNMLQVLCIFAHSSY